MYVVALVMTGLSKSDEYVCKTKGEDMLRALSEVAKYGTDPSCFESNAWYEVYQPWLRDFLADHKKSVSEQVSRACGNVASSAAAETPVPDTSSNTASCSSAALGSAKECLTVENANDLGRGGYYIKATCPGQFYAAVTTYDESKICSRQVVQVRQASPAAVYSYFANAPRILDAVDGTSDKFPQPVLKCYTSRHKGGPC
jgi:hypothetical protein